MAALAGQQDFVLTEPIAELNDVEPARHYGTVSIYSITAKPEV